MGNGDSLSRNLGGLVGVFVVFFNREAPDRETIRLAASSAGQFCAGLGASEHIVAHGIRNRAKLPMKTFCLGRIKAAVWENEADQKKFFNVTFARTYIDEAKNYHDTDSYGRDDLPLVAKLADQAHTFIFERLAELKSEHSD